MPKSVDIYRSKSNLEFDEMLDLIKQCCHIDKTLRVVLHSRSKNPKHLYRLKERLNLDILSSYNFVTIKNSRNFRDFYSTPNLFKWGTFRTSGFSEPNKQGFEIDVNRTNPKVHIKLGLPYIDTQESIKSATNFISKANSELCLGFRDRDQIESSIESLIKANYNLKYRDANWEFKQGGNRYLATLSPRQTFDDSDFEVHRTASVSILIREPNLKFIEQETYGSKETEQLIAHYNPDQIDFHCTSIDSKLFKLISNTNSELKQSETEFIINPYIHNKTEQFKNIINEEENCYISISEAKIFSETWNTNMDFVKTSNNTWEPEFEIDIDGDDHYKNSVMNLIGRELIYNRSE
jgi:hypothetical protein